MISKSRLAPLKSVSVSRVQLLATTMASKADALLRHNLNVVTDSIFWTHSTVV